MKYKRPESVLIVIATQSQDVLLMQRADHPQFWQSVTGSLEPEETHEQAAYRELTEETGLTAGEGLLSSLDMESVYTILPYWRERYAPDVHYNREVAYSFVLPQRSEIRLDRREHLDHCWLPAKEAVERAASPSNQEAIIKWLSLLG